MIRGDEAELVRMARARMGAAHSCSGGCCGGHVRFWEGPTLQERKAQLDMPADMGAIWTHRV